MNNFKKIYPSFEHSTRKGCIQRIYVFNNGFGASVINDGYGADTGRFELAVLYHGHLDYDTCITNDVIGWLSEDEVQKLLRRIKRLHARGE